MKYKRLFVAVVVISNLVLFVHYFNENDFTLYEAKSQELPKSVVIQSKCECRKETVSINKMDQYVDITIRNGKINLSYNISTTTFKSLNLACDLYKSLRRGPNQKIISFSLYGNNSFYYSLLETNIRMAQQHYPDWSIRIYHDDTIDKSIICRFECALEQRNQSDNQMVIFHENVDFCNVNELPKKDNFLAMFFNANYMLPMSWRWLPIGDDFVDLFVSRDTDSCIFDRERAAVNEWLQSNTLFHVMRGILQIFQ